MFLQIELPDAQVICRQLWAGVCAMVPPLLQPTPPAHVSECLALLPSSVVGAWTEKWALSRHKRNISAFRNNKTRAQGLWYPSLNAVQSCPSLLQAEAGSTTPSVHSPALCFTGCSAMSDLLQPFNKSPRYLILHPLLEWLQEVTSPDAGKIYHLSGCSSLLGHLSSKIIA